MIFAESLRNRTLFFKNHQCKNFYGICVLIKRVRSRDQTGFAYDHKSCMRWLKLVKNGQKLKYWYKITQTLRLTFTLLNLKLPQISFIIISATDLFSRTFSRKRTVKYSPNQLVKFCPVGQLLPCPANYATKGASMYK